MGRRVRDEQPAPSALPIVAMTLSALAAYALWQFDPGLVKLLLPLSMILALGVWLAARSG